MSAIQKTEAVVLSVLKYSDSSKIASLYTKRSGRISVIVKGGRTRTSAAGRAIDPLNHVEAVYYTKDTREIQTLSSADIINYFPRVKSNYDGLKYALAIAELVNSLLLEHEQNTLLFDGLVRILNRIESAIELPLISYVRFYLFLLGELGFELSVTSCSACHRAFDTQSVEFSVEKGLLCEKCINTSRVTVQVNAELFSVLTCLKKGNLIASERLNRVIEWQSLLEKFAEYHIPGYKRLNALKL
jgi:DNA repair protein RecO (recombination protein O)